MFIEKLEAADTVKKQFRPEASVEMQASFADALKMENTEIKPASFMEKTAPSETEQAEQIGKLVKEIPELEQKNWEKLNPEQRVKVLQELENGVAKIEMRNPMRVMMKKMPEQNLGYMSYQEKVIVLNQALVESTTYKGYCNMLNTIFHEGRHAYQYSNLFEHIVEKNTEMVEAWRLNINELGYEQGLSNPLDPAKVGFKRYLTQPVEVDARVFAEKVMQELGVKNV